MVSDALRQEMLAAAGMGELAGDDISTGAAEHPVCGDVLEIDCRIEAGRIAAYAWRATACPATMAVAAAAAGVVLGAAASRAVDRVERRVQELGGLDRAERHALKLFGRAFAEAVGR